MSGAYTAIADDSSLFFYNLGGMANFHDLYVEASIEVMRPRFLLRDQFGQNQASKGDSFHILPLIGLVEPIVEDVHIGFGLNVPYGLGSEFNNNPNELGFDTASLIALTQLTPALCVSLRDNLSIGFGPNIGWAQFQYDAPFRTVGIALPVFTKNEADGFGLGGQLGILWQATEKLYIGLRYTSALHVNFDGNSTMQIGPFTAQDAFSAGFTFPSKAGIGFAFDFTKKWMTALDLNWYGYSATPNSMVLDFENLPIKKNQLLNWKDNWSAHWGAKFQASDKWCVRAGIGYQSQVIPDSTISTLTPDVAGWDVATGIEYRRVNVSAAAHLIYAWGQNRVDKTFGEAVYSAEVLTGGFSVGFMF